MSSRGASQPGVPDEATACRRLDLFCALSISLLQFWSEVTAKQQLATLPACDFSIIGKSQNGWEGKYADLLMNKHLYTSELPVFADFSEFQASDQCHSSLCFQVFNG
jgi:hypothetical protein